MKFYVASRISDNMFRTPEGYLVCVGVPIARTGIYDYAEGETPIEPGEDGITKIKRDPEEVFRPETIASFQGKSFTIRHPEEFVNPENWKELTKGVLQNVRRGEKDQKDDLLADLLITDQEAIDQVVAGVREVSCGYEADYIQTGEGQGKQTNIVGNHLALVPEGRAGSSYAINDHKGEGQMKDKKKSLMDSVKALFGKAQDEAIKLIEEETKTKKAKTADEDAEEESEATDDKGYDELVKMVKDLSKKIGDLVVQGKMHDEEPEEKSEDAEEKEEKSEDADEQSYEERVSKLEAMIAKLMKHEASEDEEEKYGEGESEDDDAEDDDFEESTMVGDSAEVASRAEILSPGIKITKDLKAVKVAALKKAYATDEGKKAIHKLTGGKAPAFDSAEKIDLVFNAAAELLKVERTGSFGRSKRKTEDDSQLEQKGMMTAEKINEINKKHFEKTH